MSDVIKLDVLDTDGAIREAEEAVAGDTRANFFRKAALTGGATALGGGVLMSGFPSIASAVTPSKKNDVKILNFALTLEYLESEFYNEGSKLALTPDYAAVVKVIKAHEAAHVKTLKKVLGKSAVKKPTFDFGKATTDINTFLATAAVLEDTGVSAYAGQGPYIKQTPVAVAALSIHSVEARHAAVLRYLNKTKGGFAPATFDKAASMSKVLKAVKKTGFIKG